MSWMYERPWLTEEELDCLRIKRGKDCKISRDARIFGGQNVTLSDNVRIDAGTIILAANGFLKVGKHVHISCHNLLLCAGGITLRDHCGISFGNKLISASEDFASGNFLLNPNVPEKYRNPSKSEIVMDNFAMLGTGSLVLQGAWLREGAVVGGMSLVKPHQVIPAWELWHGTPAKFSRARAGNGAIEKAWDWANEYAEQE